MTDHEYEQNLVGKMIAIQTGALRYEGKCIYWGDAFVRLEDCRINAHGLPQDGHEKSILISLRHIQDVRPGRSI